MGYTELCHLGAGWGLAVCSESGAMHPGLCGACEGRFPIAKPHTPYCVPKIVYLFVYLTGTMDN